MKSYTIRWVFIDQLDVLNNRLLGLSIGFGELSEEINKLLQHLLQTGYWNGLPRAVQEAIVDTQDGFKRMDKPQYPEPKGWQDY